MIADVALHPTEICFLGARTQVSGPDASTYLSENMGDDLTIPLET